MRASQVREEVVAAVLEQRGHFHLDDLAASLREKGVSRATVYRTLPLLLEAGLVRPTLVSGQRRSYEVAREPGHHGHLICRDCNAVVEFDLEPLEKAQRALAAQHGYQLVSPFHELVGVCPKCQRKKSGRVQ